MQNLTSHINQSLNSGLYLHIVGTKVGTKSVHFRYTIRGILQSSQNKKA
jgi:hypothetical protein